MGLSDYTNPRKATKTLNRDIRKAGGFEEPLTKFADKMDEEARRQERKVTSDIKKRYRQYYDPVGYYKNYMEDTAEQQEKATNDALEEQKRTNAENERLAQESLDLQAEMAEEQAAMNELQRQELERQREERKKKQAADDAYEAEQNTKVKSRGRRRIALVNTNQQDENILGNTTVGRKRVLGN